MVASNSFSVQEASLLLGFSRRRIIALVSLAPTLRPPGGLDSELMAAWAALDTSTTRTSTKLNSRYADAVLDGFLAFDHAAQTPSSLARAEFYVDILDRPDKNGPRLGSDRTLFSSPRPADGFKVTYTMMLNTLVGVILRNAALHGVPLDLDAEASCFSTAPSSTWM